MVRARCANACTSIATGRGRARFVAARASGRNGAGVVLVAFVLNVVATGAYGALNNLLAAIIITAIYWIKYSTMKVPWPVPIETIVLAVAGISAVLVILQILPQISTLFNLNLGGISVLVNAGGVGVMAFGAWRAYSTMPKAKTPPKAAS